jgi:guanylate kinase
LQSHTALFGRHQRRARGSLVVVTGFLGSGKTTLIRTLLDKPEVLAPRLSSTSRGP